MRASIIFKRLIVMLPTASAPIAIAPKATAPTASAPAAKLPVLILSILLLTCLIVSLQTLVLVELPRRCDRKAQDHVAGQKPGAPCAEAVCQLAGVHDPFALLEATQDVTNNWCGLVHLSGVQLGIHRGEKSSRHRSGTGCGNRNTRLFQFQRKRFAEEQNECFRRGIHSCTGERLEAGGLR